MKKKITFLITAAVMLLTMMATTGEMWGQTRTATDVLTLDCATPAPTGSTSTALSSTSDVATFLNAAAGLSSATNKITCSNKTGDVYKGKGSGGGNIPQQCLKIGKASGPGSITFTIPENYDNIDVVEITCYGWKTSSSISINSGTAQTFSTAQVEMTKTFELASSTRTITISVTTSAVCITEIVLKKNDAPTVAIPIFNPAEGIYTSAQNVVISTTTEGATIYYTTDGTDPTTSSAVYSSAIPVSTTTTIKAMATATGYDNSSIASATYTIVNIEHAGTEADPYTVADARAAIDVNTGVTGVYATGIVSEIVTPYGQGGYTNITFNIVDQAGDEVFLQAYRCVGTEAANVQVGYTAVVTGNLTKYGSTYEFAQGCTLVSLTPPATPYITADDVEIAYDATFGEIGYTINNPVAGGHLEQPTTEADWLDFGNIEDNIINFTCEANDGTQRVAQVVLTYLYGTESVSKEITVTQAGNPDAVDHIEDITAAGTYTIQGTIVAKSTRGFVLGDGTGYIYYYKGSEPTQSVGDIVRIVGEVSAPTNYKVFQYTSSATISSATSSEYVPTEPVPTSGADMDGTVGGDGVYQTDYVQYVGTLSVSGTYYNITNIEGATTAQGSISYPTNTDFTSLNGKQVTVTGYYVGVSSNKYFNTMLGSIEEVVGEPSITLAQYTYDINADGGNNELPVTYTNMPADPQAEVVFYDATGTTATTYGWITATINTNNNIDGSIAVNEGEARSAYFKVKGIDADNNAVYSDLVTINQAAAAAGPSIVFTTTSIDIIAGGENRTMSFDYEGLGTSPTFSVNFYTATGEPTTYDWISGEITDGDKVTITVDANEGDARTAYFKVYGANGATNAESNVVTVNQAAYVPVVTENYQLFSGDLVEGDYLIVYDGVAMNNTVDGDRLQYEDVTPVSDIITTDDATIVWHIAPSATSGYWTIYSANANAYAASTGAKNKAQMLADGTDDKALWAVSGDATYDFVNKQNTTNSVNATLRYNAGYGFACYATGTGGALSLYKKVDGPLEPSIIANDVEIAYNVTAGEIEYTINNPVDGGSISAQVTTGGDWPLAITSISETSVNFTIPENESAEARTGVIKLTYTYGRAIVTKDVNVTQAAHVTGDQYNLYSGTLVEGDYIIYYDGVAMNNIVESDRLQYEDVTPVSDIITTDDATIVWHIAPSATTGYWTIYSANANAYAASTGAKNKAQMLADGTDNKALWAVSGDATYDFVNKQNTTNSVNATLRYNAGYGFACYATGTGGALSLYKKVDGPLEPSIIANDVEIAYNVTAGEIEYTINNPVDGGSISAQVTTGGDWPLAITSISETSVNFTIPENESAEARTGVIRLTYTYGRALVTKDVNVTQTGNPALVASITVNPDLVEVEAAGGDGTLTITVSNMTIEDPNADLAIEFYDGNGTTITEPDWIVFDDFEASGESFTVYYMIDENTGELRQAFFKVYGMGDTDFVYSNLVTINQAAPVTPGTTGTIVFGKTSDNSSTPINAASVTGNDNLENTWTITTVGTTSFTNSNNVGYAQVGSGSAPATSITFTTTLPSSATITAFEAKFGGFSGTAGNIALKVDDTTVGQGSLNATEDVIVTNSSTATGTTLTVTVTNIAKGVKCYYISYTISTGSDPIIVAQNTINLSSTDTYGEFDYEVINAVPGTSLNATSTDSWISNINVTGEKVTFTTTQNTSSTDDREGTITLSYEGATNKTVSVIQSKVDYATLPFAFDGGRADIETTVGLTQNGLDSDYGASPKLKFNTTGDWVILKLNAGPASLSYDIKGNGFSGGTFDVEISVDGVTYTNIAQYTSFGSDVQPVTHIILDDNTRYVRWIYTEKSGGNVALGNIHASANYDIYGTLNIDSFDATMHPTTVHEKGIINAPGMVMSSQPDDLVIEDGGQVITNVEFMATLQKNITGYGEDPNAADGWYLISSPVAGLETSAVAIGTYDLFAYEEETAYWWSNTGSNSFTTLEQGVGYLYANSANQTLNFAGTMVGTNTAVEKAMTAECTYDNLKGYNLMGNPFTCNLENGDIKIGATAITSVLVAEGGDDYVTVNLNEGAVKPGQGFMVQTEAQATLTLNPGGSKGANSGFVRIVAGNENATDRAYINVANGNTLRKISLSDDNTKVYVMNDGKDYAAARVDELIGSMPVHFKAAEDGEYTITIEAVNTDTEYMHLIDNFTGDDIDLLLESSYTFNATTNDSEARFRLDFGTYGVNEIAENNTFAYQHGNEIVVSGEGDLQIFDVMGRMVKNTKINGVQSVNVPANAVYIFKLDEKVQKIVVR